MSPPFQVSPPPLLVTHLPFNRGREAPGNVPMGSKKYRCHVCTPPLPYRYCTVTVPSPVSMVGFCATDGYRSRPGPGLLPDSLIRRLAAQVTVRSVEVVEVLPLLEPVVEQLRVVDHDAIEHSVELLLGVIGGSRSSQSAGPSHCRPGALEQPVYSPPEPELPIAAVKSNRCLSDGGPSEQLVQRLRCLNLHRR